MILSRQIEPVLSRMVSEYPVVTLTGPRQSGKTTLCRKLFPERAYFSLEDPESRRHAQNDPRSLLESVARGGIIDEVQRVPELLSYIQGYVDSAGQSGMFVLTGSARFELLASVSQSLAGRTSILRLLPFTMSELFPDRAGQPEIDSMIHAGFYPRIHDKQLNPTEALAAYCSTYVERDVRQIINVRDLGSFDTFLRLCAGRTAQLLNTTSLGNDCGVSHNTVVNWLSALQASYLVLLLRPYHRNFSKRLVKSPKLFFLDPGLCSYLLGIENPLHVASHPLRGSLFESLVVSEILKYRFNRGQESNLYFWRDNVGHEIDVLLDFGGAVLPVEIKSGKTVADDFFKNIDFFRSINKSCSKAAIVYGGDRSYVQNSTWVLSIRDLAVLDGLDHRLSLPSSL